MPPPPPGTPTVTVHDGGYRITEPVLGCARYPDGSLILITYRVTPWSPTHRGPATYRTRPNFNGWKPVWAMPEALAAFITTNAVGVTGKASNRRVEIVDHATVIPAGHIHINYDGNTWFGY
jgi:hypothetical protein